VRYDDIRIYAPAIAAEPGRLAGVVANVLFLGTNIEVDVRCGDLRIIGSIPAGRAEGISAGQHVSIGLDLQEASIFHV
jgi:spermidine/putrescine transport system ATP-binding protein